MLILDMGKRQKPKMRLLEMPNFLSQDQIKAEREDGSVEGRTADRITARKGRRAH